MGHWIKQTGAVTRKEVAGYFGSPLALIFLATFVGVTLFIFFWAETFFARGIADVRPLFTWMPLLLIFLVAALTMRQWSEEQRSGTLEMLLTMPVSPWALVVGKFLAVMIMVIVALALTLPLPITVSMLGNLDWGPVIGGYLAALLLAAAYAAIGLFISSLTDSQIVSLIVTMLVGGLFYLVGTTSVTDFFGGNWGNLLRSIGTGSRFESIERGVVDLRDLIYYLSITGAFLALNTWNIERKRWSNGDATSGYRRAYSIFTWLVVANLLLANVWVAQLRTLRVDLTEQREYTLSQTTKDLLQAVNEPLLIRAYVSENSHPLLQPLRPTIQDMLSEYELAGNGNVTADVVDPTTDADVEAEATQTYGIQANPFQVSGRYESSIINAYFSILVRYGDQDVVLDLDDLIDVTSNRDGSLDVQLKNLEYDLTSAIKKVVYGFQSVESVLSALPEPVTLTLYATPNTLPDYLADVPDVIGTVANDIASRSDGKFVYTVVNPDDTNATVTREQLANEMGLQPFYASFFANDTYYLHMVLQNGDHMQVIYPAEDVSEAAIRSSIENALKRSSSGFLKTIGLWTPPSTTTTDIFGQTIEPLQSWSLLSQQLSTEYTVEQVDMSSGLPPENIDVLLVVMPNSMTDLERYAIDQYLMRGGSVIAAAGNYRATYDQYTGLSVEPLDEGIKEMLASYGVEIQDGMVMDSQNIPFPLPVQREIGGVIVQDYQAVSFPWFVDVRQDTMDTESGLMSGLASATMAWSSPVLLNEEANADRTTSVLMYSSDQSWVSTDTNLNPDYTTYPDTGYPAGTELGAQPLAVAVTGTFSSYFADKENPLTASATSTETATSDATPAVIPTTRTESPDTARLVVIGSGEFADDLVIQIVGQMAGDQALNNLQLVQNAVDWAVEDADLLTLRGRGAAVRLLDPLSENEESVWEIGNYVVALALVLAVGGYFMLRRRNEKPMRLEGES